MSEMFIYLNLLASLVVNIGSNLGEHCQFMTFHQWLMEFCRCVCLCNALSMITWQNKNVKIQRIHIRLKLQEGLGLDTSVTVYTCLSSTQKRHVMFCYWNQSYYWRFTRGLYSSQTQNEMLKKVMFFSQWKVLHI